MVSGSYFVFAIFFLAITMLHFFFVYVSREGRLLFIVQLPWLSHFNKLLSENKLESPTRGFYMFPTVRKISILKLQYITHK